MTMTLSVNTPNLWGNLLARPQNDGHKYDRGHVAIYGAPELTGATRLAATACSRIGAGLVSVIADENADLYKITLPADVMVRSSMPPKVNVVLGGPGGVRAAHLKEMLARTDLAARVFDADALQTQTDCTLFDERSVLTPHVGEFERMFGSIGANLPQAAAGAAAACGATFVLKSSRTVIADPKGRLVVNQHTSPYLAKAGTGDVLAGMIAGLLAQGMPHFEACCAAVWMHGEAGVRLGAGLVSTDISDVLASILTDLLKVV